jgi:hypothetical protein
MKRRGGREGRRRNYKYRHCTVKRNFILNEKIHANVREIKAERGSVMSILVER